MPATSSSAPAASPPAPAPAKPLFSDHFTDPTEYYTIGRKLGTGNFAKVVLATLKADRGVAATKLKAGQEVAIKVMKKPSSRSAVERLAMLRAEVEILRSMNHPNVVTLYEVFESQTKLYLVMELLTGGELFDRIVGMGKYSEEDARYFTFKLLNAVLYLHDRQICHRDLKPENILLASQEENAELKISDFGLSKVAASDELLMSTRCGTPGYVAPEVLTQERGSGGRRYGTACDMWSVGVIVYILLCAAPPFYGKTDAEMNRKIRSGSFRFPDKYFKSISAEAKDFICRLLTVDPAARMSAAEALQHEWIVAIGVYTNDLFSAVQTKGVPVMQARFDEFNYQRRSLVRARASANGELQDLFALPADEEELQHFRCAHGEHTGHLVLFPSHLGFLAYNNSSMFSMPLCEVVSVQAPPAPADAPPPAASPSPASPEAAADGGATGGSSSGQQNSLLLEMSNGKTVRFDGFWERESALQLIQACGRYANKPIPLDGFAPGVSLRDVGAALPAT